MPAGLSLVWFNLVSAQVLELGNLEERMVLCRQPTVAALSLDIGVSLSVSHHLVMLGCVTWIVLPDLATWPSSRAPAQAPELVG